MVGAITAYTRFSKGKSWCWENRDPMRFGRNPLTAPELYLSLGLLEQVDRCASALSTDIRACSNSITPPCPLLVA